MAKTATFKVYNGSAWEELTFTPSSHTHDDIRDINGLVDSLNDLDMRLIALEENSSSGGSSGSSDGSGWVKKTETFSVSSSTPIYVKNESLVDGGSGVQITEGDLPFSVKLTDGVLMVYVGSETDLVGNPTLVEDNVWSFYIPSVMDGATTTPITTGPAYIVERGSGGSSAGSSVDLSGYLPLTGNGSANPMTGDIYFGINQGIACSMEVETPDGDRSFAMYSFNEEGFPCINTPLDQGRVICISKRAPYDDYLYYDFGEEGGSIALKETVHKFQYLGSKTLTASGYYDLLSVINTRGYNELMIIVRATGAATIGIDDSTTASSSGFGASKAVTGTSYTKIMMNKTSDGYYAWDVGGNLWWTNSTTYRYLRAYTTVTNTITIKVYVR